MQQRSFQFLITEAEKSVLVRGVLYKPKLRTFIMIKKGMSVKNTTALQ